MLIFYYLNRSYEVICVVLNTRFFIRNQFIRNVESRKITKKLLELHYDHFSKKKLFSFIAKALSHHRLSKRNHWTISMALMSFC